MCCLEQAFGFLEQDSVTSLLSVMGSLFTKQHHGLNIDTIIDSVTMEQTPCLTGSHSPACPAVMKAYLWLGTFVLMAD